MSLTYYLFIFYACVRARARACVPWKFQLSRLF